MKTIILLLLFTVCCYCLQPHPMTSADEKGEADSVSGDYLLMQPIHDAITSGDFSRFTHISAKRISVNFEAPFQLSGYLPTNKFIDDFSPVFALFEREKIE
ncbi:MAG: hypothetical protein GY765_39455 [bacterium]|nr:hypothetical protein [bacterium]